ncbi:MAG: radical SAM protein [Candidatus Omnitrophica bacterium]|nr:radical SAM protein [Candidatus Omnitrophota bacterium]
MEKVDNSLVRFTWNITYNCNYRCSYCFFDGKWEEYKKRNVFLSIDEWMKHWGRAYEKYGPIYLIITGGEPFTYPNFIELIKNLSSLCYHINISSNSSGDLNKFVTEIDPKKVSLSLSFQKEFDKVEDFIARVLFIRAHGFQGCLNFVAHPHFLDSTEEYRRIIINNTGEELKVIPFFGEYKELNYPQSYTQEERKLVGIDDAWFRKVKRRNSLCAAGWRTALVFPDGKVARCGQIGEKMLVGDFFDPDFSLFESSLPCEAEYCPCDEGETPNKEEILPQGKEKNKPDNFTFKDDKEQVQALSKEVKRGEISLDEVSAGERRVNSSDSENKFQDLKKRDIHFAWDIHYRCNFRCPYCWFFTNWAQQAQHNIYLNPQEWMVHWQRVFDNYGQVRIEITGGEPFLYPQFIKLVKELSSIHIVKITTNMSGDIDGFVKEVSPERVYLDLNFHPVFCHDLDEFIRKTKLLHNAGFDAGVCYLAYPPQMGMLDFYHQRFKENGIRFALAAFWGIYNEKQYPAAYTDKEKELIKPFLGDLDRITFHLEGVSPKGKLCNAGYKYVSIHGNGEVVRCAQYAEQPLGNILDSEFRLFNEPKLCEAQLCPGNEYDNIC